MARALSTEQTLLLRMRAQGLYPCDADKGVAQIVRDCGGIQAQDAHAAPLSARARGAGLTTADVARARCEERSIIHTWAMRGTLHWLATEDVGWLLALLGPIFIRSNQKRRAELGLDEDTCARGIGFLREALAAQGPLTRARIVAEL